MCGQSSKTFQRVLDSLIEKREKVLIKQAIRKNKVKNSKFKKGLVFKA